MAEQTDLSPSQDECATFVQRYCASIIDLAVVLVLVDITSLVSLCLISDFSHIAISFVCQLLIFILYFSIFESSPLRATPGKLALRLEVVRHDGGKITWLAALWRIFVSSLPLTLVPAAAYWYTRINPSDGAKAQAVIFTFVCLGLLYSIGYVMMLFTPKRQSLFDQITKRVVLRKVSVEPDVAGPSAALLDQAVKP